MLVPWVRKIPWRRVCQPTPVFLPRESHGQRSLAGIVHGVAKSQIRLRHNWANNTVTTLTIALSNLPPLSSPWICRWEVMAESPNLSHHWFPLATSTPNTPTPTPVLQRLSKIHLTSINSDWEEVVRNNKDTPFTFDVELFQELERNRIYQKMLLWLLSLGKLLRF